MVYYIQQENTQSRKELESDLHQGVFLESAEDVGLERVKEIAADVITRSGEHYEDDLLVLKVNAATRVYELVNAPEPKLFEVTRENLSEVVDTFMSVSELPPIKSDPVIVVNLCPSVKLDPGMDERELLRRQFSSAFYNTRSLEDYADITLKRFTNDFLNAVEGDYDGIKIGKNRIVSKEFARKYAQNVIDADAVNTVYNEDEQAIIAAAKEKYDKETIPHLVTRVEGVGDMLRGVAKGVAGFAVAAVTWPGYIPAFALSNTRYDDVGESCLKPFAWATTNGATSVFKTGVKKVFTGLQPEPLPYNFA